MLPWMIAEAGIDMIARLEELNEQIKKEESMKTIAQQLNIKEFPFVIRDKDGNEVYYEDSNNYWVKKEYKDGNLVYWETSSSNWWKQEFKDGKAVCYEDSDRYRWKREYKDGKEVYFENSDDGVVFDCRS